MVHLIHANYYIHLPRYIFINSLPQTLHTIPCNITSINHVSLVTLVNESNSVLGQIRLCLPPERVHEGEITRLRICILLEEHWSEYFPFHGDSNNFVIESERCLCCWMENKMWNSVPESSSIRDLSLRGPEDVVRVRTENETACAQIVPGHEWHCYVRGNENPSSGIRLPELCPSGNIHLGHS